MQIPVLSKIKFLIQHLWHRLDQILVLIGQAANRSQLQTETLGRLEDHLRLVDGQIDALSEYISLLVGNNALIIEALGRSFERETDLQTAVNRVGDWLLAFDAYNGTLRDGVQLISAIKTNVERLRESLVSNAEPQKHSSDKIGELESLVSNEESQRHIDVKTRSSVQPSEKLIFVPKVGLLALNPELRLYDYLQRFLQCDVFIDVGAHKGDFASFLLRCGYQVYGFEPNPDTFAVLKSRLAGHSKFHGFELAVGDQDGEGTLTIPSFASDSNGSDDSSLYCTLAGHSLPPSLTPGRSLTVKIRSLSALVREKIIPDRAGILKIDVEGYELGVLTGAGRLDTDIIMAEFWSPDSAFATRGTQNNPMDLHFALRERGYSHLITFNRVHGSTEPTFHINCPEAMENSWGNMMVFRDEELFRHALKWCDASLRRVYFGVPPDVPGNRISEDRE